MDLLDRLLRHDAWTTRKLLRICHGLRDEQLDRPFDLAHRTVRATLSHVIRNVEVWTDLMAGCPPRDCRGESVAELEARAERAFAALESVARNVAQRGAWDERFLDVLDNPPVEKSLGGGIAHLITHSMHHRAQLLYMLRRLGITNLPEGDVLGWEQQTVTAPLPPIPAALPEPINLQETFARFSDYRNPRIVGELNGQQVKLVKFQGEFVWHKHDHEDELFLVVKGRFCMEFRDRQVWLNEGELLIVPRGVEHRPVAEEEVHVMLFEPASTLNTGNVRSERTVAHPDRLMPLVPTDAGERTGQSECDVTDSPMEESGPRSRISIRRAELADLPRITEIYNEAILTTTATFDTEPKTAEERLDWFQSHGERHPVLVAVFDGRVIGWACISRWSERPAYNDTAETSFYVHSDFRGRGIGRQLKEYVIAEARRLRFHTLLARVAEGSDASLHLHDIRARDPLPGFGQQGLHADWRSPPVGGSYAVVTALCLLDEFSPENGATRVVPGTHRFAGRYGKSIADPRYVHPQQCVVEAKAGSALVFNGHLWHSGTRNRSRRSRRTLQISYRALEYCDRNAS